MQKNYRDILHILFKHRKKSLTFLLFVITVTLLGSLFLPRVYESSAKLLVKIGREDTYSNPVQANAGSPVFDSAAREERINSDVEILSSRPLIESVIGDIGVDRLFPGIDKRFSFVDLTKEEKAVLELQKKLKFEPVRKSDVILVKFRHQDRVLVAEVVNRVMDRFIELHSKVHQQERTFSFFDDQAESLNRKLLDAERSYDAFRSRHDISSLGEQKTMLLQQISETELDRSKIAAGIREAQAKLNSLVSGSRGTGALGQETDVNPIAMSAIRSRLSELRIREQELKSKYAEGSYPLVAKQQEIARAAELLKQEELTYNRKAVETVQQTLKGLRDKESSQIADLRNYRAALQKISAVESRANDIERELKIKEDNYQLYVKRMEEARITQAMDKEKIVNVSMAESALPPIKPIWPKPFLNMIMALGFGTFGGIALAFVSEFLGRNFNRTEDAESCLQLPVLSSIIEIKKKDHAIDVYTERKQLPYFAERGDLE